MLDHLPAWASSYVGLPYRNGGMTADGLNCWGLVRLVLRERLGIDLPSHVVTRDIAATVKKAQESGRWQNVGEPQSLDVAVMMTPVRFGVSAPLHVGVMVTRRHVLHIDENEISHCADIRHASVATRLESFWRYVRPQG